MEIDKSKSEYNEVALQLVTDPDNYDLWVKLLTAAENLNGGICKKSSNDDIALLYVSYKRFLDKFPLYEKFWIIFANWFFKLGQINQADLIFLNALKFIPSSVLIWENYLKFKILTVHNTDGIDRYKFIKRLFLKAELKIGLHYLSTDFWDLYLKFEEENNENSADKKFQIYLILRKLIELPIYGFSKYYEKFMNFLDLNLNLKDVSTYVTNKDLIKLGYTNQSLQLLLKKDSTNSDFSSDIPKILKDIKNKIKKIYTDLYITVQYEVFKIYEFEKKIVHPYFHTTYLSKQELLIWESYLNYYELDTLNYTNFIVQNFHKKIQTIYERCLISTALYDKYWLRYANYYINLNEFENSKNILLRSIFHLPKTSIKVKLKLVLVELYQKNYFRVNDIIIDLLSSFKNEIEIWVYFLNIQIL
ncbi:mRNA splicing protein PRP42 ASCRUDRAFT_31254, partial [Ascoidea rubescens DSM 1968]